MSVSSGDDSVFTHACVIVQIALKSGLHQLMKGAYNSGEYNYGNLTTYEAHMKLFKILFLIALYKCIIMLKIL